MYSTHKHTPQKPRLRLIIPLWRPVSAQEYVAIGRRIAADIDIEQFDDTTYEPARLMYWPSTSKDGEFVFEKKDGDFLKPESVLAQYADWHDSAQHPISTRQKSMGKRKPNQQADPLEKDGVIGAFCRAYTVQAAIETFLSDVYQPSAIDGRYDYVPADSAAGVLVYDDKFAYSHHATDPACAKLLNAFDLVRLHKFMDLDQNVDEQTPSTKLPSYLAMQQLCMDDQGVRLQLAQERIDLAKQDFTVADENWQARLDVQKNGQVVPSLKNLILILENDSKFQGLRFNKLSDSIEITSPVPWENHSKWWRDADDSQLLCYIDRMYGSFSARYLYAALAKVVDDRAFHPIHDYLNSLPAWDGVERVDTLLIDYLGAEDNEYTRAVTRKHLCAAIARAYTPGCKYDPMLVLNGGQGIGKSTLIAKLGGAWFSDSLHLADVHDKTGVEKLQGYWIVEICELAGIRKADEATLRGFLSCQNDIFRASYGRRTTPHPRQCVFFGTTNAENGYLRDTTGNRRFLHVKVSGGGTKRTWAMTQEDIDQIWAETLAYYKAGEQIMLDDRLLEMAREEQREAMEGDEREGMVREYLDRLLPTRWPNMTSKERTEYIQGWSFDSAAGKIQRTKVCAAEIWVECFAKNRSDLKRQQANEIHAIMCRMEGWSKYESGKNDKMNFPQYGVSRGYVRLIGNTG